MTIEPGPFTPRKSDHFELPETPFTPEKPSLWKRALRDSTNEQTKASQEKPTPRKPRKVAKIEDTATLIRDDHDCKSIDTALVVEKVRARLFFSLSRFAESYAFNCLTTRGKTHINGAHAHCGGCHAAHAAFSCKLYDDIFDIVRTALFTNCFSQLMPAYQGYLTRRFGLSTKEIKRLNSENQNDRLKTFDRLASTLTAREKRMTFSGTAFELQRGSTFQGPIFSNHLDSSIEAHMRKIEDELDLECARENKTPVDATIELQESYRAFVLNAIKNMHVDLANLDNLKEAWDAMIACQKALSADSSDEAFESYLNAIDDYLLAHQIRFKKVKEPGTASLENLEWYLRNTQSPYVLRELQGNRDRLYFELSDHHLKIDSDSEEQFTEAITEVEGRLTEAHAQLDSLNHTEKDFKLMLKYGFGKLNDAGVVITPDKARLGQAFVDLIPEGTNTTRTV
ncbi:MAG: hypothetical protein JSS30_04830 [Verrucomicrobia bacterium]|nr:hypothetical protein [Verrucomicrobiota bacterium]